MEGETIELMDEPSKINVSYRRFWPNFNKNENFISQALTDSSFEGEIEVTSVFETTSQKLLAAALRRFGLPRGKHSINRGKTELVRKVWFTGENKRPPHSNQFEAFISFDQDPMGGKNAYFPLFYVDLLISHPEATLRRGRGFPDPQKLLEPRVSRSEKPKGVCAFISNGEPTRLRAIEELSKWIDVDVYGPWVKRPVPNKYQIAQDYKFTLCFENDLFPGYITEKLLDAYICDTVPLYWGNLGLERHINRSSFINAFDHESLELFAERVGKLSRETYEAIYVEPLMKSLPSLRTFTRALTGR
jgi:hypothetical protein